MNEYSDFLEKPITDELNDAKRERELIMGEVISQRIKFIDEIKGGVGEDIKRSLENNEAKKETLLKRIVRRFIEKC